MKNGDFYNHYKNVEYSFGYIALPLENRDKNTLKAMGPARYHEDTHDFELYIHEETRVIFIGADVPHVIYQSEKDYGTDRVFAREVDDFFGYKEEDGQFVKRFTLKK